LLAAEHSVQLAREAGHVVSLCNALTEAAWSRLLAGDVAGAERLLVEQTKLTSNGQLAQWAAYGRGLRGVLRVKIGAPTLNWNCSELRLISCRLSLPTAFLPCSASWREVLARPAASWKESLRSTKRSNGATEPGNAGACPSCCVLKEFFISLSIRQAPSMRRKIYFWKQGAWRACRAPCLGNCARP